jgi:hypothetical protein
MVIQSYLETSPENYLPEPFDENASSESFEVSQFERFRDDVMY